jgi:hypothetical protein
VLSLVYEGINLFGTNEVEIGRGKEAEKAEENCSLV